MNLVKQAREVIAISQALTHKLILIWNNMSAHDKGLRKSGDVLLRMFIKEIDILTPDKLRAIRRMRSLLSQ